MYLTKQLTLFKTPLSPTYENVYDDYSTYTDYENFLLNNFSHIEIDIVDDMEVGRDKSVIDKNGIFSLVVKGRSSMDIHDYNYCCFETDKNTSSPLFAFILSVDSLNDSRTSPSCRINCQLDAWTHNIFDIVSENEIAFCERRTYSDIFTKVGNTVKLHHLDNPPDLPAENKLSPDNAENKRILFALVRTDGEFKYRAADDTTIADTFGVVPFQSASPLFYIPVLLKDDNGDFIQDRFVLEAEDDNNIPTAYNFHLPTNTNIAILENTHTLEGVLTYLALDYTIDYETKDIYFPNAKSLWLHDPQDDTKEYYAIVPHSVPNRTYDVNDDVDISELNMNKASVNVTANRNSDPAMKKAPIIKKVICVDGTDFIPVNLHDTEDVTAIISVDDTSSPKLTIQSGNKQSQINVIEYKKKLMLKYSSSDLFMRNNSASYVTSQALAGLNVILGAGSLAAAVVTGGATLAGSAMLSGGIISGIKQYAKKTDADNAMDTFIIPSSIASDELKYGGDIFVTSQEVVSEIVKLKYYYDIHYYGSYFDNFYSIIAKTRYDFDYTKTNNAKFCSVGNVDDRIELQNAFARGVRMWHISSTNTQVQRTMNKQISNIPITLLNWLTP